MQRRLLSILLTGRCTEAVRHGEDRAVFIRRDLGPGSVPPGVRRKGPRARRSVGSQFAGIGVRLPRRRGGEGGGSRALRNRRSAERLRHGGGHGVAGSLRRRRRATGNTCRSTSPARTARASLTRQPIMERVSELFGPGSALMGREVATGELLVTMGQKAPPTSRDDRALPA